MPPVSERQRRAMFAAKAGKSTLGIPQSVGADFVKADPGGKLPKSAPKHEGGGPVRAYATGKYAKGGYVYDNPERPRGGPPVTERSKFMKEPDPFRTSIEEQDYPKSGKGTKRPAGEGKVIKVET